MLVTKQVERKSFVMRVRKQSEAQLVRGEARVINNAETIDTIVMAIEEALDEKSVAICVLALAPRAVADVCKRLLTSLQCRLIYACAATGQPIACGSWSTKGQSKRAMKTARPR